MQRKRGLYPVNTEFLDQIVEHASEFGKEDTEEREEDL